LGLKSGSGHGWRCKVVAARVPPCLSP
jgi:hypothetical protein